MRCAFFLLSLVLSACCPSFDPQQSGHLVDDLVSDPARLQALRAQCAADWQSTGEYVCRAVAEALQQRFFAGHTGPDEYRTLVELPSIPASFDEPTAEEAP
ncbi:hypothetical protein [Xanthomonas sacchari]|uniref:hypothetical protein n=1 Tax=Xanthomonas sacchari TaxID=56458 RepID=UPI00225DE369|nr:hypothetical protein [Xanthomonas sacchari]MCW0423972.1 hypothetical protein [Xanthomonas sacchari]